MMDTRKILNGCGKEGEKWADGLKEDEGTSQTKLRRMGMMGEWMEVGSQLNIKDKTNYWLFFKCLLRKPKCPTMF